MIFILSCSVSVRRLLDSLESVRSVRGLYQGLHSFRNMRRMEASLRNARALRLRFSQSLASRRQRFNQAMVRSTIHRLGSGTNPLARSERLTISVLRLGRILSSAVSKICQKAIFGCLAHGSPKDILPALPGDLGRGDGAAPSARFLRPLKLRLHSLLATLRFTEWLVLLIEFPRVPNQKGESSGGTD
jgi:hypothetical protein